MGVRDSMTLAKRSVIIVNSDVADSQTIANFYCAMYGIPTSNQFVYAMGTNVLWEYTADRYATFWTDLYNKVISVDAYAVFVTAGCPVGIELLEQATGTENVAGYGINLGLLVGFIKRIVSFGGEPQILSDAGYYPVHSGGTVLYDSVASHKAAPTGIYVDNISTALQLAADADYTAAGGLTTTDYQFTTYKSSWNGDFSIMDNLLTGLIGYATLQEGTHPANLWDLSRVILGKSGNFQIPASAQGSRVALVCPENLSGNTTVESKTALIGKKLIDLGLDVRYWYPNAPGAVSEALLPVAGEDNWSIAQLNASTAAPTCTYQLGIGVGFENGKEATWATTMIPSTSGGLFCGGKSYGNLWGKANMVAGSHSSIIHIQTEEYGWHQTARQQQHMNDIWLNLIAGKTLAEAAWCGLEYTFLAIGDPLMRPFPQ